MEDKLIERLRRKQVLRILPDGREGVDVTVQFLGEVPSVTRPERKAWLRDHFTRVCEDVRCGKLVLKPDSVSVSAQTVQAVVPVNELETVRRELAEGQHRVDIDAPRQITDS